MLYLPTIPTRYSVAELESEPITCNARLGHYTTFANLLDLAAIAVPNALRSDGTLSASCCRSRAVGRTLAQARIQSSRRQRARPRCDRTRSDRGEDGPVSGSGGVRDRRRWRASPRRATQRAADRPRGSTRPEYTDPPAYHLYERAGEGPARPGLVRVGHAGVAIEFEVWAFPVPALGVLLAQVPAPLTIGTVELEDGSAVKGFLCEAWAADGAMTSRVSVAGVPGGGACWRGRLHHRQRRLRDHRRL